jgi:hypothetical protein
MILSTNLTCLLVNITESWELNNKCRLDKQTDTGDCFDTFADRLRETGKWPVFVLADTATLTSGPNGTACLGVDGDGSVLYIVLLCCVQNICTQCFVWILEQTAIISLYNIN